MKNSIRRESSREFKKKLDEDRHNRPKSEMPKRKKRWRKRWSKTERSMNMTNMK